MVDKNFRMPAEWEPHQAVWLAWPHDEISFPGRLEQVKNATVKIIFSIHHSERVELLVLDKDMCQEAQDKLLTAGVDLSKVRFRITEYMDGWMRDCGGIFVKKDSGIKLVNFIFNTWGNKFPDLDIDKNIPPKVAAWSEVEMANADLVSEGGAIDVNGQGIGLTTEQCLLNNNRNPGKTKQDIEKYLTDFLGIKKTIWLKEGLTNDHTDGHIDEIARFVSPNKIVCAFEENQADENYQILQDNYQQLLLATDLNNQSFEIIKLPMPHMIYQDGTKAPVSYCNFYIGNKVVLAATFNDENDAKALEILQSNFPRRKVIGIDCSDIIYGGGAIHCMTQQQPV